MAFRPLIQNVVSTEYYLIDAYCPTTLLFLATTTTTIYPAFEFKEMKSYIYFMRYLRVQ